MRKVFLSVCVAFVLMTMAPAVAADDLVGASGECYSENYEEGGGAHISVSSDGEVSQGGIVNEDDPTNTDGGIVDAVTTFGQGQIGAMTDDEQEDACEGPARGEDTETHEAREGEDYLEVHAGPAQVCYDGDPNVHTDEEDWCDTEPHGVPDEKDDEDDPADPE